MMRMMMKSVMAGGLASLATLTVFGEVNAAPCVSGVSLASYIALGATGCQIGDKTFNNFAYIPDGNALGITPNAAQVTVNPNAFGFNFVGNWNAPVPGAIADSDLSYTVAVNDPLFSITGAHLAIAAVSTGVGSTAFTTETITPGGVLHADTLAPPGSLTPPDLVFAGVPTVNIDKDIGAIAGAAAGSTAQLSSVTDFVTQTSVPTVPEPASLAILGASLLGIGVAYRRRSRK